MEMKDYNLTCGEVIDNLLMLADAYEKASAGKAPNGFAFNPTDAAANMKAAVHFIVSFGQQLPRWIPVEERLPEPDYMGNPVGVLAYLPDGDRCVGFCDNDEYGVRWHCESTQKPTHWMPLPEPPVCKSIEERIRDHVCDTVGVPRGQVAEPVGEEVIGLVPPPEPPEVK